MGMTLKDLFSLEGRTALVSGGAGYLGTAMCEALAELGANVVIASRDQEKCGKAASTLQRASGDRVRVMGFGLDLL
jgi:gluconate 5-dehydrogenase